MPVPMVCPRCQADFRGKEIPPADRSLFGGETQFSRVVGVYSDEADATVVWQCPDCGHAWARTEELPFGLRTFELMSPLSPGVGEERAFAEQRPKKKWWQFWK